jgi:hypothetical protein
VPKSQKEEFGERLSPQIPPYELTNFRNFPLNLA